MKTRCPACGKQVEPTLGQWCRECGNCFWSDSESAAETTRNAAEHFSGGTWMAAPTPLVGVYAVFLV